MRIYLDACCLCRTFDDQSQERVRIEAESIRLILDQCRRGVHVWVAGEVLEDEISRDPRPDRRAATVELLGCAKERPRLSGAVIGLAQLLVPSGLRAFDALHVAMAESSACEVFLTADDQLRRAVARAGASVRIRVENPVPWLLGLTRP